MRRASELSRSELATVVDAVQQLLYLDFTDHNQAVWNPDKSWNGTDVCDQLSLLLTDRGLVPRSVVVISSENQPHSLEQPLDLDDSRSTRRAAHRRPGRATSQHHGCRSRQSQRLRHS